MGIAYHPTADELYEVQTAPHDRRGGTQPTHWAWPTVGGHGVLRRGRWVVVDVAPNPAYWGGEQPW